MFERNRICKLFNIQYPIIQGGMVWCSGWKLASAVSNAGGLGLIGAGSMSPELLKEHIQKCKQHTNKPFGVNLPLLYSDIEKQIQAVLDEKVEIVFSSAGNPKLWTPIFKAHNITVVHVVPGLKYALKAEDAGVDAIVAEGFEAGGHNGREETTTFCLIPQIAKSISLPIVAAGGVFNGASFFAAMALGAEGIQVGSRFAVSKESSAHENFKNAVFKSQEGETRLMLKKLSPVRLLLNDFAQQIWQEEENLNPEDLKKLLGKNRSRDGILNGDIQNGKLEIGQVAALLNQSESAEDIINELVQGFRDCKKRMAEI